MYEARDMSKNVTFMLYGFILGLMLLTILSNLGDLTRLVIVLLLAAICLDRTLRAQK